MTRVIMCFLKHIPGTDQLIFAPNGTPDQVQGSYGISAIDTSIMPTYLMSYDEVEFLKAEANVRLGNKDLS